MKYVNVDYTVRYENVDNYNRLTMKGFLGYLVSAGSLHSDIAGYGLDDIPHTHVAWVVLNWKLNILSYPKTGDKIHIKTWCRNCSKLYTYRDYEISDEFGNIIAIASSKWTLIDTETKKLAPITADIIASYSPVERSVFNTEIPKIKETTITPSNIFDYTILRRDLDTNQHVNNLNYIDFAIEALPNNVYDHLSFSNIDVMYKKQCLLGDKIRCLYSYSNNNEHIITIKSADLSTLHAIVILS